MAVKLHSAEIVGLEGEIIDVETDLQRGLFRFAVVGLPDKAVEEAKERVSLAVKNSGFKAPQEGRKRVIVSLAPADLKKEGPLFDLAIALSYLLASKQAMFKTHDKIFLGELALDGGLRKIKGALALSMAASLAGFKEIIVPEENAREASLVEGIKIIAANNLGDVVRHLTGEELIPEYPKTLLDEKPVYAIDFGEVRGQESAKRGLEIAAAGGHHVLMAGPPGTGKTMLARALPSIMPPLDYEEMLEVTKIHSIAGLLRKDFECARPFRSPHHTSSYVALVGGGQHPRPGEITLAHRGVLFLDEFPEFERRVLEALRQPLEEGAVTVSRARGTSNFPARALTVLAMNPCPCGNYGSERKPCLCSEVILQRYQRKISGPIADRIDLWLEVPYFDHEKLAGASTQESEEIRAQVVGARNIQKARFKGTKIRQNSEMGVKDLEKYAPLSSEARAMLQQASRVHELSARAYHRIIKLARTIADLEEAENISEAHIAEAVQYRPKKKFFVHET